MTKPSIESTSPGPAYDGTSSGFQVSAGNSPPPCSV